MNYSHKGFVLLYMGYASSVGKLLLVFFSSLVAQKSLGLDFEAMAAGTPRGDVPQRGIMEDG